MSGHLTKEHEIKSAILREFGSLPDIRLFNNPVGEAWMGKTVSQAPGRIILNYPRRVRFGLAPGSSDLIGFRIVIVSPDMVGSKIAQFVAIEVKTPSGRVTADQKNFLRVIEHSGGVAILARKTGDVEAGVNQP
jgi:hypothetical protein